MLSQHTEREKDTKKGGINVLEKVPHLNHSWIPCGGITKFLWNGFSYAFRKSYHLFHTSLSSLMNFLSIRIQLENQLIVKVQTQLVMRFRYNSSIVQGVSALVAEKLDVIEPIWAEILFDSSIQHHSRGIWRDLSDRCSDCLRTFVNQLACRVFEHDRIEDQWEDEAVEEIQKPISIIDRPV